MEYYLILKIIFGLSIIIAAYAIIRNLDIIKIILSVMSVSEAEAFVLKSAAI